MISCAAMFVTLSDLCTLFRTVQGGVDIATSSNTAVARRLTGFAGLGSQRIQSGYLCGFKSSFSSLAAAKICDRKLVRRRRARRCKNFAAPFFLYTQHRRVFTEAFDSNLVSLLSHSEEEMAPENGDTKSFLLDKTDSLDPALLSNGTIPFPKHLSPSSASLFKSCPQSYLFQYLYGIKQPQSLALAKGSMCHAALEQVFDLEPAVRTLGNLQNLFRTAWSEKRMTKAYKCLFDANKDGEDDYKHYGDSDSRDVQSEIEWGESALRLLENYYELENPQNVKDPNPLFREVNVNANLTLDPAAGVTGHTDERERITANNKDTFRVCGIVDRLDLVCQSDRKMDDFLRMIDYKTGKAPTFKYSPAVNERIAHEAFWQLKVYALLIREMASKEGDFLYKSCGGLTVRMLRLMYLTSDTGVAKCLDMDLGESEHDRDAILNHVHGELSDLWTHINNLVGRQDPKLFVHCDRKFCWCHKVRPHFVSGTVWEKGVSDGN